MSEQPPNDANPITLPAIDAFSLVMVLWSIAGDPAVPHDRKVDAIHCAARVEHALGLPAWPTHSPVTAKVIDYFSQVAAQAKSNFSAVSSGKHFSLPSEIHLPKAEQIFEIIWSVAADQEATFSVRVPAAFVACTVGPKIWHQMPASFRQEHAEFFNEIAYSISKYTTSLQPSND